MPPEGRGKKAKDYVPTPEGDMWQLGVSLRCMMYGNPLKEKSKRRDSISSSSKSSKKSSRSSSKSSKSSKSSRSSSKSSKKSSEKKSKKDKKKKEKKDKKKKEKKAKKAKIEDIIPMNTEINQSRENVIVNHLKRSVNADSAENNTEGIKVTFEGTSMDPITDHALDQNSGKDNQEMPEIHDEAENYSIQEANHGNVQLSPNKHSSLIVPGRSPDHSSMNTLKQQYEQRDIAKALIKLLRKLTKKNPDKRLSAAELLTNRWISSEPNTNVSQIIVNSMEAQK